MLGSAIGAGFGCMVGRSVGFAEVMARGVAAGVQVPEVPAVPAVVRKSASVTVDRRELLERLRVVGKGDGVLVSVNGRVDLSGLFGRSTHKRTETVGSDGAQRILGRSFHHEILVETREDWEHSGELVAEVPVKRLQAILQKSKTDVLQLELWEESTSGAVTGQGLTLTGGKAQFTLETEYAGDWEHREPLATDSVVLVDSEGLRKALAQVVYATDVESTRYALGGVLVELSETGIIFAATDSRRLAKIELAGQVPNGFKAGCTVVPVAAVEVALQQLKKTTGPVAVAVSENRFEIEAESWTVAGMAVDGRFPLWRKVIPAEFKELIQFDRLEMLETIEAALIVTDEEHRGADINLTADGLRFRTSGAGECTVTAGKVTAAYGGVDVETCFDPRYLMDYLKATEAESVVMGYIDGESAMVFEADGAATYVMMPLSRDR